MSHTGKISIVIVLDAIEQMQELIKIFPEWLSDIKNSEFVLVANGVEEDVGRFFLENIHQIPDATLHFLPDPVDIDQARLIGMDNAVGDTILCITFPLPSISYIQKLIDAAEKGFEHILLINEHNHPSSSLLYRLTSKFYVLLYRVATGIVITRGDIGTRLYSRAATQYILHHRRAEMLLHAKSLNGSFPSYYVSHAPEQNPTHSTHHSTRTVWQGTVKGWRVLMRSTSMPLRLVTITAIGACLFSISTAGYAVLSKFFNDDVAPGWTTLTLHMSFMFFVLSLLLALIGEYLIQIDRAVNHRLRYAISREVRSRKSRYVDARNIIISNDSNL